MASISSEMFAQKKRQEAAAKAAQSAPAPEAPAPKPKSKKVPQSEIAAGRPKDLKSAADEGERASKASIAAAKADREGAKGGWPGAHHEAAMNAHARAAIAAREEGNRKLANHHDKQADHHMNAMARGGSSGRVPPEAPAGKPTKATKLKAFAEEGKKKEAAVKGPLMKGKKGGTYRLTKTGKKIYTK